MMRVDELLPGNSGTFERALAATLLDGLPVPLRDLVDPMKTPARFLPFLAAHESVDLWFEDWPEERKRRMIAQALRLGGIKGTRAAAAAFLEFVDTTIVHKRSYPARAPVGRIVAGRTPINHPDFTARFLLKVDLVAPLRARPVGRMSIGRALALTVDREPLRRAKRALVVSKAPATAYSVTFAHRVPITLDAGLDLEAGCELGAFHDRTHL